MPTWRSPRPLQAFLGTLILTASLSGCSSFTSTEATPYKAAKSADAYGYSSMELADSQYRVMFKATETTPADRVQEYTLLRAAQLASEQGYDWLSIVKTDIERKVNKTQRIVRESKNTLPPVLKEEQCTMSGCNEVAQPFEPSDADLRTEEARTKDVYYSIVVRMGDSQVSTGQNAFNVAELLQRLPESLEL